MHTFGKSHALLLAERVRSVVSMATTINNIRLRPLLYCCSFKKRFSLFWPEQPCPNINPINIRSKINKEKQNYLQPDSNNLTSVKKRGVIALRLPDV